VQKDDLDIFFTLSLGHFIKVHFMFSTFFVSCNISKNKDFCKFWSPRMATDLNVFLPVPILIAFAILIFSLGHFASVIIAPSKKSKLKEQPYECGEEPVGDAWSLFNVRFYVVGLIFIIFDVESVLMFPIAAVFREFHELGHGGYVLIVFLSFISVLLEGIAYCWKKGDLDWIKSYRENTNKEAIVNKPSSKQIEAIKEV